LKKEFLAVFRQQLEVGLILKLYPTVSEEQQRNITQDFEDFIEIYLFESYKEGATGAETLMQSLRWSLAATTEAAQTDNLRILFTSLNQARTGYEKKVKKYIEAHDRFANGKARDWSCPPGVDERIIDGVTGIRLSLESEQTHAANLSLEDQYIQSLAHAFIRKTADGILPTPLFYSMVLKESVPEEWSCRVVSQQIYQLTMTEQAQEEYIRDYIQQEKERLHFIASTLLAKEGASFVELYEAILHGQSSEGKILDYAAAGKFLSETAQQRLLMQPKLAISYMKNLLNSAGFNVELDEKQKEKLPEILEESITRRAKQGAQETLQRVLQMTYDTEQQAIDESRKLGITTESPASEQKDVLMLQDASGMHHDLDLLAINKEELQKRISQQTGMQEDWLSLISMLFMRNNTDGFDLCGVLSAEGFAEIVKDNEGNLDRQKIHNECRALQEQLLTLGLQYRQAHPAHYLHYYAHNQALKDNIKDFILNKINGNFGRDYYRECNFPCQDDLLAEIVHELIRDNRLADKGRTLRDWLIRQGCTQACVELLTNFSPLMTLNSYSTAFLEEAVPAGQCAIVEFLLDKGVYINQQDDSGRTALYEAARRGHQAIVELLLARGANTNVQDRGDNAVLLVAVGQGNRATAELLLKHRADINMKNYSGDTPLFEAIGNGDQAMVKLLLEYGADVNLANKKGVTPLMLATARGDAEILKEVLRAASGDVYRADNNGNTTLSSAASHSHREIEVFLIEEAISGESKSASAVSGRGSDLSAAADGGGAARPTQNAHVTLKMLPEEDRSPLILSGGVGAIHSEPVASKLTEEQKIESFIEYLEGVVQIKNIREDDVKESISALNIRFSDEYLKELFNGESSLNSTVKSLIENLLTQKDGESLEKYQVRPRFPIITAMFYSPTYDKTRLLETIQNIKDPDHSISRKNR
jgi:ankyrin repeat protein